MKNQAYEEELKAFHESAHAYANFHFAHPVSEVAIVGGDNGGYCALMRGAKRYFSNDETQELKQRGLYLERAITFCAGHYGVMMGVNGHKPDHDGWQRSDDRAQAMRQCMAYCDGDAIGAEILLRFAMRQAELLVEKARPQITRLAFALIEHERLDGAQIDKVLDNGAHEQKAV